MEISMKNRVVLITGGSRGIGAELVRSFCSLGAKVYFTFKSNQQAAQEIMNSTGAIGKKVDGSNEKEVKEFCDYVGKEHKVIDVLVNNAGSVPRALLVDTTVGVFKSAFLSNVGGVFNFSRSCLKYLFFLKLLTSLTGDASPSFFDEDDEEVVGGDIAGSGDGVDEHIEGSDQGKHFFGKPEIILQNRQ